MPAGTVSADGSVSVPVYDVAKLKEARLQFLMSVGIMG